MAKSRAKRVAKSRTKSRVNRRTRKNTKRKHTSIKGLEQYYKKMFAKLKGGQRGGNQIGG
jgi:hypothetical protein